MKVNTICISFLLLIVALSFLPQKAFAQTLSFDPTQEGVTVGQQFTVKININTGSQQTSGADALITFDPNILSVSTPTNGGFYSEFAANPISGTNNKWLISGFETTSTSYKTGTGVLANVPFTAKGNGTSAVSFDCTNGSKADSNIMIGGNDIINCTTLAQASYTVGPSNATPITSGTSGNLPRSGSTEVTIVAVAIGIVLTIVGVLVRL